MNKESQIAPNDTRFKKGHSGNAKGRPRKPVRPLSTGSQFRKVAKDQITIEIAGSLYKTSRWNAYVRQIYNMALNKNSSAARLLEQLRRWFPGDLLPGDPTIRETLKISRRYPDRKISRGCRPRAGQTV